MKTKPLIYSQMLNLIQLMQVKKMYFVILICFKIYHPLSQLLIIL